MSVWDDDFWDNSVLAAVQRRTTLRGNQQNIVEQVLERLPEPQNHAEIGVRMPPGAGKSFVAAALVHAELELYGADAKVLWVTRNWLLARHAMLSFARLYGRGSLHKFRRWKGERNVLRHLDDAEDRWRHGAKVRMATCAQASQTNRNTIWVNRPPRLVILDNAELLSGSRPTFLRACQNDNIRVVMLSRSNLKDDGLKIQWIANQERRPANQKLQVSIGFFDADPRQAIEHPGPDGGVCPTLLFANARETLARIQHEYLTPRTKTCRPLISDYNLDDDIHDTRLFDVNEHLNMESMTLFNNHNIHLLYGHGGRNRLLSSLPLTRARRAVVVNSEQPTDDLIMSALGSITYWENEQDLEDERELWFNRVDGISYEDICKVIIEGFVEGIVPVRASKRGGGGSHRSYTYDPETLSTMERNAAWVAPVLRGMWVRDRQTFGVEIELTSDSYAQDDKEDNPDDWIAKAKCIWRSLNDAFPDNVAVLGTGGEHDKWCVVEDASCGWEVTSPVLEGTRGFETLVRALDVVQGAADGAGLIVNHLTGVHVHLGWSRDEAALRRAKALFAEWEPALATIVAPSRIWTFDGQDYDTNTASYYCRPVSERSDRGNGEDRYRTFNTMPIIDKGTVECRMHSGTLEARKIIPWVSLFQLLMEVAQDQNARLEPNEVEHAKPIEPNGDICAMIEESMGAEKEVLRSLMSRRRAEIVNIWSEADSLSARAEWATPWLTHTLDAPNADGESQLNGLLGFSVRSDDLTSDKNVEVLRDILEFLCVELNKVNIRSWEVDPGDLKVQSLSSQFHGLIRLSRYRRAYLKSLGSDDTETFLDRLLFKLVGTWMEPSMLQARAQLEPPPV